MYVAIGLCLLFIKSDSALSSNWTSCEARDSMDCKCAKPILVNVIARCHFNHLIDLKTIIKIPLDILRLNLSRNNIQEIPPNSFYNYSQLIYLSLSSNNIHSISEGAFNGLKRLRELNLQDNMIKQWNTTLVEQDLPNLIILNVAQNIYWKPDQKILTLPNLKAISLLEYPYYVYDSDCLSLRCHLIHRDLTMSSESETIPRKNTNKVDPFSLPIKPVGCFNMKLVFKDSNYWKVIHERKFHIHCEVSESRCLSWNNHTKRENTSYPLWYDFESNSIIKSYCWNTLQKIHITTLIIGICAMVFNLIIIITTSKSRVLRKSVAHVLVANIAVGDLLISFYMIIITSTRQSMSAESYYSMYLPYFCRVFGTVFLIGQFISPGMSFIMTLERYLAVVYCMRPQIRITLTMCCALMVLGWSTSIALAVSFMTSPQFSIEPDKFCVPLGNSENVPVIYKIIGIGVGLYIIAIALYGHMYVDFKRTNQKTVQLQRENRLACKMAPIVFTNVLFFISPLLAVLTNYRIVDTLNEVDRFIFFHTFLVMCLATSSCFNPILFSFRNEKFRNEFKKHCFVCRNKVHVFSRD